MYSVSRIRLTQYVSLGNVKLFPIVISICNRLEGIRYSRLQDITDCIMKLSRGKCGYCVTKKWKGARRIPGERLYIDISSIKELVLEDVNFRLRLLTTK
jgi:hypothetical protein